MEDVDGGRTRWTLVLQQPVSGPFFIIAHASLPPAADGSATAPPLQFEQAGAQPNTYQPLTTQLHYLSLVNHSRFQMEWQAGPHAQRVRPDELDRSLTVPQELIRQSVDLLRLAQPLVENRWRAFAYQSAQLLPASVNLADHLLWIAPDGSWRAKVRFKINNRARQFLPVRLPAEGTLIAAQAQGQPVRPLSQPDSKGRGLIHLIPLPRGNTGDLAFEVNLVLIGKLRSPWTSWNSPRSVDLPLSHVVSQQEDATLGIPVAREILTLYLPEKTSATIVHNPAQTNAEFGSEDSRLYDEADVLLSEMSSLIQIQSSSQNAQTRSLARNNLRNLSQQLQEYDSRSQSTSNEGKLGSRKLDFQRRSGELSKAITDLERQQQQEPTLQRPSESDSDTDGLPLDAARSRAPQQQAIQGNDFLTDNADRLYLGNSLGQKINAPTTNRPVPFNDEDPSSAPDDAKERSYFDQLNDVEFSAKQAESKKKAEPAPKDAKEKAQPGSDDALRRHRFGQPAARITPENPTGHRMGSGSSDAPFGGRGSRRNDFNGQAMGGGGMGGGGLGGAAPNPPPAPPSNQPQSANKTDRGTLSLPIEFQPTGRKLVFSHLNGDMKLALTLWPHETFRHGVSLLWTLAWLAAGILLLKSSTGSCPPWLLIAAVISLLLFLGFPVFPWNYFAGLLAILTATLFFRKRSLSSGQ
ncbi:MAG: hypothetical protein U0903_16365 [Planctomycetales bacterium]